MRRRRWGERDDVTDTRAWEGGGKGEDVREGGQPYLDDGAEDEHDQEDEGDEALEDVHDLLSVLGACI